VNRVIARNTDGEVLNDVLSSGGDDWTQGTGNLPNNTSFTAVDVGLNLLLIEEMVIHFERAGGTWPTRKTITIADIKNTTSGYMVLHFYNDYLALRASETEKENGVFHVRSAGQSFRITRIQFRKK